MFWIPALIAAAATAATGIAGAVASKDASDNSARETAKDRALREKLAKMQLLEQQRQYEANQQEQAHSMLGTMYANQAQRTNQSAQDRIVSNQDMEAVLQRAFMGRG